LSCPACEQSATRPSERSQKKAAPHLATLSTGALGRRRRCGVCRAQPPSFAQGAHGGHRVARVLHVPPRRRRRHRPRTRRRLPASPWTATTTRALHASRDASGPRAGCRVLLSEGFGFGGTRACHMPTNPKTDRATTFNWQKTNAQQMCFRSSGAAIRHQRMTAQDRGMGNLARAMVLAKR